MKWSFVIQQKVKAALLLSGIMAVITLNTFISRNNIQVIGESFSSIYADRLVPVTDIVYLSESLHKKRLIVEKQIVLSNQTQAGELNKQLKYHQSRIDSLLTEFQKTSLVDEETRSLKAFKQQLQVYAAQEAALLELHKTDKLKAQEELFNGENAVTFQQLMTRLHELTAIQTVVGQALVKESKNEASVFNLMSTIQIISAIVVGLCILGLIHNSKIINKESTPFHLN